MSNEGLRAGPALSPDASASRGIRVDPERAAPVLLAVSPCRSGSTVLLRVFGYSGVQSHFQPLKNVLRWHLEGKDYEWQVPCGPDLVFVKETLGPFTAPESLFDPLQALLGAGYPRDRLRLLILGREPLHTWASWRQYWRDRTTVGHFVDAYLTTVRVEEHARRLGIDTTWLVFEALGTYPVDTVVRRLMARAGVAYTPDAVGGWEALPGYGEAGSNVVLPEEPPPFITPEIHDPVIGARRLEFVHRALDPPIPAAEQAAIEDAGLFDVHAAWTERSTAMLESAPDARRSPAGRASPAK